MITEDLMIIAEIHTGSTASHKDSTTKRDAPRSSTPDLRMHCPEDFQWTAKTLPNRAPRALQINEDENPLRRDFKESSTIASRELHKLSKSTSKTPPNRPPRARQIDDDDDDDDGPHPGHWRPQIDPQITSKSRP